MINHKRQLSAVLFAMILPMTVSAEALVVDGNESIAMVEEPQAVMDAPVAKAQIDDADSSTEEAFAIDNDNQQDKSLLSVSQSAKLLEGMQRMQQELQELRGQLDVQSHELKLLKEQQVAFYKDLDARLNQDNPEDKNKHAATEIDTAAPVQTEQAQNEATPAAQEPAPVAPSKVSRVNPADEQISYLAAYDLVKSKRFDDAIKAMQTFVAQYPQGGYSANAQYWLGELYMVKNQYPQAIEHFEVVIDKFPSSSKSAASLLKVGYALAASGKTDEARTRLQQVVKNYPDTQTATLARSKLETLDSL